MRPGPTPFTIAIAGGSGSGKTTLCRALLQALGHERCALLDHDSYYRCLGHLPAPERARTNFDHPDALDNDLLASHLAALRAGRAVAKPCYDFATHSRRTDVEAVQPRPLILAEGVLLLAAPQLRRAFDLRVFVDAPPDIRALRRVQRDTVERGRTLESVCRQYVETVRPMHERFVEPAKRTADLVLRWPQTPAEWTATVIATLERRLRAMDGSDE